MTSVPEPTQVPLIISVIPVTPLVEDPPEVVSAMVNACTILLDVPAQILVAVWALLPNV